MLSRFFVLSQRGDSIITRELRGDNAGGADVFFRKVKLWKGDPPPVFNVDGVNYFFVQRNGLYFVCTTWHNACASFVIEVLSKVVVVCKDYCGTLNEDSVRRNYVLIYELLDEMLDFGFPQSLASDALKSFVFNEPVVASTGLVKGFKLPDINPKTTPSSSVQKPISLSHDKGVRGRNEVFVDIAERVSALFNATGHIVTSEIQGCVQMKSYLIGNPELRIALNPDLVVGRGHGPGYGVVLDDANFHECVKLENFEREKELLLVPPDGEFVAMNYRVTTALSPPFRLFPTVMDSPSTPYRLDLELRLKAEITEANYGCNMVITFPVPKTTTSVTFSMPERANGQRTEYKPKAQTCFWRYKRMPGNTEAVLNVKLVLSQPFTALTKKEIGPFSLAFEIPMYNASGVNVKFLEILQVNSKQKPYRWVRYVTHANSYVVRL